MDNRFILNFRKKENLSEDYRNLAREIRLKNNNLPSEKECVYLQKSADIEYELSQISTGAEQEYHEQKKNRLDREIKQIKDALSTNGSSESKKKDTPSDDPQQKTPEEEQLDRTARTWYREAPNHSFADVSGMNDLKKKLQECITDSKMLDLIEFLKIPHLNSYFFIGPPGCGKTYIINAFAHELLEKNYKFLSLQGSDIISRYVGDAEKIVTRLFNEAAENAPCIVFIDEIDSVCKNRSLPNLPEYAANITTSFLEGFNKIHDSNSNVIFIGATNYPQRVDSAMLDRVEVIEVPLPDMEARAAAFCRHFDGDIIKFESSLTYVSMAEDTNNFNYRDIDRIAIRIKKAVFKELIDIGYDQEAAIDALKTGLYVYTLEKWKATLKGFKPSPKKDIIDSIEKWKRDNMPEELYDEDSDTSDDDSNGETDEPIQEMLS